jgi:hypothetical protein
MRGISKFFARCPVHPPWTSQALRYNKWVESITQKILWEDINRFSVNLLFSISSCVLRVFKIGCLAHDFMHFSLMVLPESKIRHSSRTKNNDRRTSCYITYCFFDSANFSMGNVYHIDISHAANINMNVMQGWTHLSLKVQRTVSFVHEYFCHAIRKQLLSY